MICIISCDIILLAVHYVQGLPHSAQIRDAVCMRSGNYVLTGNSLLFDATMRGKQILQYICATKVLTKRHLQKI